VEFRGTSGPVQGFAANTSKPPRTPKDPQGKGRDAGVGWALAFWSVPLLEVHPVVLLCMDGWMDGWMEGGPRAVLLCFVFVACYFVIVVWDVWVYVVLGACWASACGALPPPAKTTTRRARHGGGP
jgi:hypothetical protein